MRARPYTPADRDACLRVFESNVPEFFVEHERAEFSGFLDELPGPYLVIEDGSEVIACGGYAREPGTRLADLCWGMVRRDLHRRGIGGVLLRERLARIAEAGIDQVRLDTTQHSRPYYERAGFRALHATPDGYAPGMHRFDMLLDLSRAS